MKKFEYTSRVNPKTNDLNELGLNGWELVCISPSGVFYFKREIN